MEAASWQIVTQPPSLASDSLHVWRFPLNGESAPDSRQFACLKPDETARASRFHFPIHSNRYVASRFALRTILGSYLGVAPRDLAFEYTTFGKPYLAAPSNPLRLSFNVSHSQDLGVLAVSFRANLGIDVEAIKEDFGGEEVAESHFAPAEFQQLLSLPEALRPQAFFNCWTRKEAYVKALGAGLQIPLDSFEVSLLPGQPAEFRRGAAASWRLLSFLPVRDFQGAVAYEGATANAEFFDAAALLEVAAR